jgi:hypothetical protein
VLKTIKAIFKARKGELKNLPSLLEAEFGFATDTKDVFIGSNSGNVELTKKEDVDAFNETLTDHSTQLAQKIYYFNSVSDMKTSNNLKNGYAIHTLGYYLPNDGGGAKYYISDIIPDGKYVENLSNGLYAVLIIDDAANVKWFGAKADAVLVPNTFTVKNSSGVTIYTINGKIWSGTDNATFIQTASSYSNTLYFPTGNYYVTNYASFDIAKQDVTIFGDDKNSSLIVGRFNFLLDNGAKGVTFRKLGFCGYGDILDPPTQAANTGYFPNANDSTTTFGDGNFFYIGYTNTTPIKIVDQITSDGNVSDILIEDCYCQMFKQFFGRELKPSQEPGGVTYYNAKNLTMRNCVTDHLVWHGAVPYRSKNVIVENNLFQNHFLGMALDFSNQTNGWFRNNVCLKVSSFCKRGDYLYADNNYFESWAESDLGADEGYLMIADSLGFHVTNNIFKLNKNFSQFISISSNCNYLNVSNNKIYMSDTKPTTANTSTLQSIIWNTATALTDSKIIFNDNYIDC